MTDRRTLTAMWAALVTAVVLVVAACGSDTPPPDPQIPVREAAQAWVDALTKGDLPAAAAMTDAPVAAGQTLQQVFTGLSARNAKFTVESVNGPSGVDATFGVTTNWDFGDGHTWVYTTTGDLSRINSNWTVRWRPSLVHPQLSEGQSLKYSVIAAPAVSVVDRSGTVLLNQQVVTLVNLDPSKSQNTDADTTAAAAALNRFDPTITADSLRAQLAAAPGQVVNAITLRSEDLSQVDTALRAIPLVTQVQQQKALTTPRTLTSPALAELPDQLTARQAQADGWEVQSVDATGAPVTRLAGADPSSAANIVTTLDSATQTAAQNALNGVTQQAAIVALQPSTGQILAVAQNGAADTQGPIALTGLYPPGSTFKTVTTTAALQAGIATPDTVLPCPGTATIETRTIPNEDKFDLGNVALHTAFAKSCNTTMGALADQLPADALSTTAAQLGLGVDYTVPGLTTVTGTVPVANTPAEKVENGIGQGQVVASPFGMAQVASTLASGTLRTPTLLAGQPGTADRQPAALTPGVADAIRTMMRETVTAGTATAVNDVAGLLGKTGTAQFGDGTQSHGWFIGIQGDLAFAVLVVAGQTSDPAVQAAGRFLRAR